MYVTRYRDIRVSNVSGHHTGLGRARTMMTSLDNARLSCTEHNVMLANSLYHLYTQSSLLDVRLVCDEVHIYAHKAVLAAGSKFFQERLQAMGFGMVELHMSSVNLGVLISPSKCVCVCVFTWL